MIFIEQWRFYNGENGSPNDKKQCIASAKYDKTASSTFFTRILNAVVLNTTNRPCAQKHFFPFFSSCCFFLCWLIPISISVDCVCKWFKIRFNWNLYCVIKSITAYNVTARDLILLNFQIAVCVCLYYYEPACTEYLQIRWRTELTNIQIHEIWPLKK